MAGRSRSPTVDLYSVGAMLHELLSEEGAPLSLSEREALFAEILDDVFGLGPLEPLLRDPSISDILVNTHRQVFVERRGRLELTPVIFQDERHLLRIINKIVSAVGRRVVPDPDLDELVSLELGVRVADDRVGDSGPTDVHGRRQLLRRADRQRYRCRRQRHAGLAGPGQAPRAAAACGRTDDVEPSSDRGEAPQEEPGETPRPGDDLTMRWRESQCSLPPPQIAVRHAGLIELRDG